MAPIITEGFRAIGNLPELLDNMEFPKITKKDDRYSYKYHYDDGNLINHPFFYNPAY